MSNIGRILHIGFTVADLDASVRFYRDLLGCVMVMEQEKKGGYLGEIVGYPNAHVRMVHLRTPARDSVIELFEYLAPRSLTVEIEPRRIGTAHICFAVDDLEWTVHRLRASNVDFVSAPVVVDTGVNAGGKGIYLRDPDGILVELFEAPAKSHG